MEQAMTIGLRLKARALVIVLFGIVLSSCGNPLESAFAQSSVHGEVDQLTVGTVITELYWSDGDSGVANGVEFRMADMDTPETGGVCAKIGGSKCERERELGFEAKEFTLDMTRGRHIVVSGQHKNDRFGREVIDLSVDGRDLREIGISANVYRSWVWKNGRPIEPRPRYCSVPVC